MLEHTEASKKFYHSKAWKECREAYIPTVYGLCEHCGNAGYILDHIEEINMDNINDPNITLNWDNLQYLCVSCHNKKTFGKYDPIRDDVYFDSDGNLIKKNIGDSL